MSINTEDSAEVVCTELLRTVFHSNIPKQRRTDTAPAPATTLMSLHIMSASRLTVRVLSPPLLAHLMCAFSVLLTYDTPDLNPVSFLLLPHALQRLVPKHYIQHNAQRQHLRLKAVVLGQCGCTDQNRVNMVTRPALGLFLHAGPHHSHATEFPYQNNIRNTASGKNKV